MRGELLMARYYLMMKAPAKALESMRRAMAVAPKRKRIDCIRRAYIAQAIEALTKHPTLS